MEYSAAFRRRMVQRMTGPRAISANALAGEVGVGALT
jgi:transposase-like protein